MLIRRSRRPAKFAGYTDAEGYKKPDAPEHWPFGRSRKPTSSATPKGHARYKAVGAPLADSRPPSLALTESKDSHPWDGEPAPW